MVHGEAGLLQAADYKRCDLLVILHNEHPHAQG
jgi:hypothetical protein